MKRRDGTRRDATNIAEQSQHGMVVVSSIDGSISYDQMLVGTVGRGDQAINPGREFEQFMTFKALHCIKGVSLSPLCLSRSLHILELHHMVMIMDSQSLAGGDSIVVIPPVLERSILLIQILREEDLISTALTKVKGVEDKHKGGLAALKTFL